MLFTLQFPIADVRRFATSDAEEFILGRPSWPAAMVDQDFVRSFGSIRERPRGGINNWIGEQAICRATRAIRFSDIPPYRGPEHTIALRGAFRRFYFDGLAVGKVEVGINVEVVEPVSGPAARQLIHHLLTLEVSIPNPAGDPTRVSLIEAGPALAQLYSLATVRAEEKQRVDPALVKAGPPLAALVKVHSDEPVSIPFDRTELPVAQDFSLGCARVPYAGKHLCVWDFSLLPSRMRGVSKNSAREVRIALFRLHAERSVLHLTLQWLRTANVVFDRDSMASESFQYYLAHTLKHIRQNKENAERLVNSDVVEVARQYEDMAQPGSREQLLQAVDQLEIRLNVKRNVRDYIKRDAPSFNFYGSVGSVDMGDKIEISGNTGSNINVKSSLDSTSQKVDGITVVQGTDKDDLKQLIADLQRELEPVAEKDPEGAQKVADAADRVVTEAARKVPDNKFLNVSAKGLKEAAEAVAKIAPTVLAVATKIATTIIGG